MVLGVVTDDEALLPCGVNSGQLAGCTYHSECNGEGVANTLQALAMESCDGCMTALRQTQSSLPQSNWLTYLQHTGLL